MIINPLKRDPLTLEILLIRDQRLGKQIDIQATDPSESDVPFGFLRGCDHLAELVRERSGAGMAFVHVVFLAFPEAVG